MSDSEPCAKRSKKCTVTSYKRSSRDFAKHRKNRYRKDRRKRSVTRYYQSLKKRRLSRSTDELCEAASDFCIIDNMSTQSSSEPVKDVAEWWKHEQLAFWKSRAVSLELENRMLHNCLRNAYAKQVLDYENYMKAQKADSSEIKREESVEEGGEIEEDALPPAEGAGEERRREMSRLYGSMAPKITGMETAVQLNYELQVDQRKPPYWPNIPLNL